MIESVGEVAAALPDEKPDPAVLVPVSNGGKTDDPPEDVAEEGGMIMADEPVNSVVDEVEDFLQHEEPDKAAAGNGCRLITVGEARDDDEDDINLCGGCLVPTNVPPWPTPT